MSLLLKSLRIKAEYFSIWADVDSFVIKVVCISD